jgi:hypothetical protein
MFFRFFPSKCSFTLLCARSIICTQLNEVPTSLILKTPFESLNNKTDFLPSLFFSPISTYITCLSLFNSVSGFKFFSLCVPTLVFISSCSFLFLFLSLFFIFLFSVCLICLKPKSLNFHYSSFA